MFCVNVQHGWRHSHGRHKTQTEDKPAKSKSIEELRAERRRREQTERHRREQLLAAIHGGAAAAVTQEPIVDDRQRRYNSQFNPHIARRPPPRDASTT